MRLGRIAPMTVKTVVSMEDPQCARIGISTRKGFFTLKATVVFFNPVLLQFCFVVFYYLRERFPGRQNGSRKLDTGDILVDTFAKSVQ